MRPSPALRVAAASAVFALAAFLTACGDDTAVPTDTDAQVSLETAEGDALELIQEALDGPDGKDERILGTTDDDVLTTVEQTLNSQNASAEWDGTTLLVHVDGSVDDVTASMPCLMLEAFLTDGEEAVLRYSDGDVRCADR